MIDRRRIYKRLAIAVAILFCVSVLPAPAAVRLAAPFGEHMVLPQGIPVPIWGTGAPGGDSVRISFHGQSATTNSDWEGRWMVVLAPMKAGGPYQLLVEVGGQGPIIPSPAATVRGGLELNDVVVGEVRLTPLPTKAQATKAPATTAPAPQVPETKSSLAPADQGKRSAWIRIYRTPPHASGATGAAGQWVVAALDPTPNLSSESYSFGAALHDRLHVPVGIIEADPYPRNPLSPNSTSGFVRSVQRIWAKFI